MEHQNTKLGKIIILTYFVAVALLTEGSAACYCGDLSDHSAALSDGSNRNQMCESCDGVSIFRGKNKTKLTLCPPTLPPELPLTTNLREQGAASVVRRTYFGFGGGCMEKERRFIDGSVNRLLTMLMACAERILAAAALICCANKGAAAVIRCTYIGGGYNMEEEDEERRFIEHGSVVLSSTM